MNETDFETMIAEARDVLGRVNKDAVYHDSLFQYRGGVLVRELTLIVRDLADALESVCAERDAALARIAELEAELEVAMRPHSECERSGAEAGERIVDLEGDMARVEARIAEAAKLHRKYTYYELEDSCPDTTDEHREEHHHESDEIGEFYCDQMPTGDVCCGTCRDVNGDRMDWPCDTIQALDGAPESETAPENYEPKCNGACVVSGGPVTNWPVQYGETRTGYIEESHGWHRVPGSAKSGRELKL